MTNIDKVTCANFVGGAWVDAQSGERYERENPAAVDEIVASVPDSSAQDVDAAYAHVAQGYHEWAQTPAETRADVLMRAADLLAERADALAVELVREAGKTLAEAQMETRRTPQNLRMYAGESLRLFGQTSTSNASGMVLTTRKPVGVVAAITPWNFPLNIPSRKLAPALAAGNGVVFKPSELTPVLGQRLVEALLEAGVPGGAIAIVHGGAAVGRALVGHEQTGAVTFTGSTAVGEAIHASTPAWIRTQLEMGGKNAVVVMDDADVERAADIVIRGAFGLAGQACTGTSRLIVHESVGDALRGALVERISAIVIGNGLKPGVSMGPLASRAQLAKYEMFVELGLAEGARRLTAERDVPAGGYFVPPVIFADVDPKSRLAQEEAFSPILAAMEVRSLDEALQVVNSTEYGLSAAIVTNSMATALRFADEATVGLVKVNQPTSGMAINAPFGGTKRSSTQTFKEQAGASMMQFYTSEKTAYFNA